MVDKDDDEVDDGDDDAKAEDDEDDDDDDDEDGVLQTSGGVINVCSRFMYVFSSELRARTKTHMLLSGSHKV